MNKQRLVGIDLLVFFYNLLHEKGKRQILSNEEYDTLNRLAELLAE